MMGRILVVCLTILSSIEIANAKVNQEDLDKVLMPGLAVSELMGDTYLVTDQTMFWSNILITVHGNQTVFIVSSPYDSRATKSLMKWITLKFRPKKLIALNTHYHADGSGGNQVFHEWKVETWSSDRTRNLMRNEALKLRQETMQYLTTFSQRKRVLNTKIETAQNIFSAKRGKRFVIGDETIQVIFPGEAHSKDNLIVFFPNRSLLFGGCAVKGGKSLGYLRDANLKTWSSALEKMKKLSAKTVVLGHGKNRGNAIENTLKLLKAQNEN